MGERHSSSCGRRIALEARARGGSEYEAAVAVSQHCGVSLLRGHRVAHGYTLAEVTTLLKGELERSGTPSPGLAHQTVSRWETGSDFPTIVYLDALCRLYRSRPDRLGFGRDYSSDGPVAAGHVVAEPSNISSVAPREEGDGEAVNTIRRREVLQAGALSPALVVAAATAGSPEYPLDELAPPAAAEFLERRAERSGYEMYTSAPVDFVPDRMTDLAAIRRLLLRGQLPQVRRRLHRVAAINAGFIGIRLTDVAGVQETLNWFRTARQWARSAEDLSIEAWVAGHLCDAHSCYGYGLVQGLQAAQAAQLLNGGRASSAALFGFLSEAGVQARLGRRHETLEAVRRAERVFDALSPGHIAADGIRIPEYFLRWHQSNALSVIGEGRLADPLRRRALELPLGRGDLVGRALLLLDQATLAFQAGHVDEGDELVRSAWQQTPRELQVGQVSTRTASILGSLGQAQSATRTVAELKEYLGSLNRG
ncbi:hypothetical protein FraQA3DRAFT_4537 [Frankia sp. QA3]|nr:hypothetical protein FraQA3DRAFT_4537 [Frankia sp. QA3]